MGKQVNLSYYCSMNTMAKCGQLKQLNASQKVNIFDEAVEEIESLISKSVLRSAYYNETFQRLAKKSKQYALFLDARHKSHNSASSSTNSPYSALSSPPIKIDMSNSSTSIFAFDA